MHYKKIFFIIFILTFFLPVSTVNAKTSSKTITVDPSIMKIDLSNEPEQITQTYTNTTGAVTELQFRAKDFTGITDLSTAHFLEEHDAANYKYSLSSWISFDNSQMTLSPGESKKLTVYVRKDQLSPGTHYASIQAVITSPFNNERITIQPVLSSFLFVRTNTGHEIERAELKAFSAVQDSSGFPHRFFIRFQNIGNVALTPYGKVEVTDVLGRIVAESILNEGSLITLPESIRRYDLTVHKKSEFLLPGFYNAKISLRYGTQNHQLIQSLTFFTIESMIGLLITIGSILALIVAFLLLKKYHNKIRKTS